MAAGSVDEATKEYHELMDMGKLGDSRSDPDGPLDAPQESSTPPRRARLGNDGEGDRCCREGFAGLRGEFPILRAEILVAQSRLADAEGVLQKAHNKSPKEAELCRTLIALAERQQDWTKTERLLDEFKKMVGDSVDERLTEAGYIVRRGDSKSVDRLQKLAENADGFSTPCTQLWSGLAVAAAQAERSHTRKAVLSADREERPLQRAGLATASWTRL